MKGVRFIFLFRLIHCCSSFSWTLLAPRLSNVLVEITPAKLPEDLPQIQSCRKTAFQRENGTFLRSEESFINANAAVSGRSTCVVARERLPPFSILGTADVRNGYVNNVYVIQEARGMGLAKRLMQTVESISTDVDKLSLHVETTNKPAVYLYEKCGFEAKGLYKGIQAVGEVTGAPLLMTMTKEVET